MIRRRLMGHEKPVDEGDGTYTRNIWVKTLHEVVSKIDVDISRIKSPFAMPTSKGSQDMSDRDGSQNHNVVGFRRRPA